jgi:Cu+-exporting ATPase
VLGAVFLALSACKQDGASSGAKRPATPKTTVLAIKGMTCQSCVQAITKTLTETPGVTSARVSLKKGRATVQHDGAQAPVSKLIAAVDKLGYKAREAPPLPAP